MEVNQKGKAMGTQRSKAWSAIVALVLACAGQGALAQTEQTLVQNITHTGGGVGALGISSFDVAQFFTTGGNEGGYAVTRVDVWFTARNTTSVHLCEMNEAGTSITSRCTRLDRERDDDSSGTITYRPSQPIELGHNTVYAVRVPERSQTTLRTIIGDSQSGESGWGIANTCRVLSGGGYACPFGGSMAIRILGHQLEPLTGLAVRHGTTEENLVPRFDARGPHTYTARVPHGASSVTIDPTLRAVVASNTTISYLDSDENAIADADGNSANGHQVTVGADSERTVLIRVRADSATDEEGTTYTLTIARAGSGFSSTATIRSLSLNAGQGGSVQISPNFSRHRNSYNVTLTNTAGLTINASPDNSHAVVDFFRDGAWSSTGNSLTIPTTQAYEPERIELEVTAPNHATRRIYTLDVSRVSTFAATLGNAPAAHDGSSQFTVRATFNADLGSETHLSDGTRVDGGRLISQSRVTAGNDRTWDLLIEPDGDRHVDITLPATRSCESDSDICSADARPLWRDATVRVPGPLSTDADLTGLALTAGGTTATLSPAFGTNTLSYETSVAGSATELVVRPTLSDSDATWEVRHEDGTMSAGAGTQSLTVPLVPGKNDLGITVTANDGITTKTYEVVVRRGAAISIETTNPGQDAIYRLDIVNFELTRTGSTASALPVTVNFTQDQPLLRTTSLQKTATFAAGSATATVRIFAPDWEPNATAGGTITATVATGAEHGPDGSGSIAIRVPSERIRIVLERTALTVAEDTGTTNVRVQVRLPTGLPRPDTSISIAVVTDALSSEDETPRAQFDEDYRSFSQSVQIAPENYGFSHDRYNYRHTIAVEILEDDIDEHDETFLIVLEPPPGLDREVFNLNEADGSPCATEFVGRETACVTAITITDDDPEPALTLGDTTVIEGENAIFTASLSRESGKTVTATWTATTESGDSASDADLGAEKTGTLTIEPGNATGTFEVETVADTVDEGDETFTVTLSAPVNATMTASDAQATGTIENLEAAGITGISVDQRTITMVHNAALDESSIPGGGAYTVMVEGSAAAVASSDPVSISDRTVTLTLAAAVGRGDRVTVSYTAPATSPVQSTAGVEAPDFSGQNARNNTTYGASDFITKWRTTTANESISIPTGGSTASYTVDWGDGTARTSHSGDATHSYAVAGTYVVRISNSLQRIKLGDNASNAAKLRTIEQWGDAAWTSMEAAFRNATNMTYAATDTPDLSNVSSMRETFRNAREFNGDISNWAVGTVTSMRGTFWDARKFNQPLGDWDVSNVMSFRNTFAFAHAFNQPLGRWNTSNATNTNSMFYEARAFNQDIDEWDVSSVTDMASMFHNSGFTRQLFNWYVTLDDYEVSDSDRTVGVMRAQNAVLQGQGLTYDVSSNGFTKGQGNTLVMVEGTTHRTREVEVRLRVRGADFRQQFSGQAR